MPIIPYARGLLLAAALLFSGATGAWVEHQRQEARVQALMAAQARRDQQAAQAIATAERANTERLQRAMTAADAAIALAQSRESAAKSTLEQTRHELDRITSRARQCLSADAVRVLNHTTSAPAGSGLRLPTTTGSAARAAAAAAASTAGHGASEQAVAGWIATTQKMYAICAARVEAIGLWSAQQP